MLGGAQLVNECSEYTRKHGKLSTGKVFVSSGGSLPCKVVIHTVGPMWKDGCSNEDRYLKIAVKAAVEEADSRYRSVSLPAVSCGRYGFPPERGAKVILSVLGELLARSSGCLTQVNIVSGKDNIDSFHEQLMTIYGASKVKRRQQDNGKSMFVQGISQRQC